VSRGTMTPTATARVRGYSNDPPPTAARDHFGRAARIVAGRSSSVTARNYGGALPAMAATIVLTSLISVEY
jgi:hypothetical protein